MALRSYQTLVAVSAAVIFAAASLSKADGMVGAVHRHIRSLSYPEESEMGIFFALAIPLDDPISTKSVSVAFFFEANYRLTDESEKQEGRSRRSLDRRTLYALVESKFESMGYPGKQCLLRSICETAGEDWSRALHEHNGLVGNLMRIIFRPSTSADEDLASEYTEAEDPGLDCASSYHLCPFSVYQYLSRER